MRTIQVKTTVPEDRILVLQLPEDVLPGEHEFVLMIDPGDQAMSQADVVDTEDLPLRREGSVLVYDGTAEGPVEGVLDQVREERIQRFIQQAQS